MDDFVKVANKSDLKEGTMKKVSYKGRDYLLIRSAGRYFLTDVTCPHMGGDLSQGILKGTIIECPLHNSQFDLTDGHVVRWLGPEITPIVMKHVKHPVSIKVYEIKEKGDEVLAKI